MCLKGVVEVELTKDCMELRFRLGNVGGSLKRCCRAWDQEQTRSLCSVNDEA